MTFYLSITILIFVLMIAMTIHVLSYSGFTKKQKSWFVATFVAIIFCTYAEFLVHNNYYNEKFRIYLYIITILQFSISPCLAMSFAGALGLKHQHKIAIVYLIVGFLTEAISAPFNFIFGFDGAHYFRGKGFIVYEIFYFLSLIYLIVALIIVGRRFRHRDFWTITAVLLCLIAGIIPMTLSSDIHVAYLSIALSACLCYVYYNDLVTQDMNTDLLNQQKKVSDMQVKIISGLANLIESRDTETGEHVIRTSEYVRILAEDCRAKGLYTDILTDHYIELLYTLAPMHDVGKIVVSDTVLKKPGKLTPEEYEEIKKHAAQGGKVVRQVLADITDEEYLAFASDIATYHHERWDGSGYPFGIKGEDIPLCARFMTIADSFDALVSKRCYKDPIPVDEALELMKSESGTHFDPKLLEVFLKYKEKYIEINEKIVEKD